MIYSFKCEKCDTSFDELVHTYDEVKDVKCPQCNELAKKVISGFLAKFKGSGFYSTDNRPLGGI